MNPIEELDTSMNAAEPDYSYTQRGRSVLTVLLVGLMAALAVVCCLSGNLVCIVVGVLLAFLAGSGIYAFLKGETWRISIEDGVLRWDYSRWPKTSGRIALGTVRRMVIDDCSSAITMTLADGARSGSGSSAMAAGCEIS